MTNSDCRPRSTRGTRRSFLLTLALTPIVASAHDYYGADFTLVHPWAEATLEGHLATAPVYFSMEGVRGRDRLIRASTRHAARVELRSSDGPSAKVVKSIDIAPADHLDFGKDQPHLVLCDLKVPLQWGRSYEMTMVFEKSGPIQVMVSVGSH